MSFGVAGTRDCKRSQKWALPQGFLSMSNIKAGVAHLKRLPGKRHFPWQATSVPETCSSEMLGGPGADFLRVVAFWSFRSSSFGKMILCDRCNTSVKPGLTFSWQAQHFKQMEWKNRKTHWHRGRQLCTQLSIFEGSLAEFLRFWCCQLGKLRRSRGIASFLTLSSSKIEES